MGGPQQRGFKQPRYRVIVPLASHQMTALANQTKAQLIEALEATQASLAEVQEANELLAAAAPTADKHPADNCLTGMLSRVDQATRKDGTLVDDLFKVLITTSVRYTTGKDANGDWVYAYVNNHKSVRFNCDEAAAIEIQELIDTNQWTKVRAWYSVKTNQKNVISKDVVRKDGKTVTVPALRYQPDFALQQLDVISSKLNDGEEARSDEPTDAPY